MNAREAFEDLLHSPMNLCNYGRAVRLNNWTQSRIDMVFGALNRLDELEAKKPTEREKELIIEAIKNQMESSIYIPRVFFGNEPVFCNEYKELKALIEKVSEE